jgi:hypothetical protein
VHRVTILHVVFLAAFIGGLLLAVFAMLHGVENTRARRNRAQSPSPFFNLPAIAAFAVGFGAAGYPLVSRTDLPAWGVFVIALATGCLATSGMIILLASWALRKGRPEIPSEEDGVQGQLGIVTREIAWPGMGEVAYTYLGERQHAQARSIVEKALPVGTEVVIDRIENDVAFVEEWSAVEQRL